MKEKTGITYNKLCAACKNNCKQSGKVLLIQCPRFVKEPVQLDIFSLIRRLKRGKK